MSKLSIVFLIFAIFLFFGCTASSVDSNTNNGNPIESDSNDANEGSSLTNPSNDINIIDNNSILVPDENTQVDTPITEVPSGITLSEVATHNTRSNCWMIINKKVYNLSAYTNHPDGSSYVPYCGKDGTKAYDSIKGGRGHSNYADSLLNSFYVGDLAN